MITEPLEDALSASEILKTELSHFALIYIVCASVLS